MTDQAYIHDGYEKLGYIAAVEGLYPAVRFQYRALLAQDRAVIIDRIDRSLDPRKREFISASAIAGHLLSWDIVSYTGCAVELTTTEVLKVTPALSTKIYYILMSHSPSDIDPGLEPVEQADEVDAELEAAYSGTTPEALDAKN